MTRAPRKSRRGLAGLIFVLAVGLLAAGTAASAEDAPPLTPISFELLDFGPPLLGPGEALTVHARIDNPGMELADRTSVVVRVTTTTLKNREALDGWATGDLTVTTRTVATGAAPGALVPAGGSGNVTAVAGPASLGFPADSWGVYGVEVALIRGSEQVAVERTFVTWLDQQSDPVPLSVIVEGTGNSERIDAVLQTADDQRITVLLDPSLVDTLVGTRLMGRDVYALPSGNVDVASLARTGAGSVLDAALAWNAQAALDHEDVPRWIALVPDADHVTASFAFERGAAALLTDPGFSTELSSGAKLVDPGVYTGTTTEGGRAILIPDAELSAALTESPLADATAAARVVAESALLAQSSRANTTVLVYAGAGWRVRSETRSLALDALLNAPWFSPTTLTETLATSPREDLALEQVVGSATDIAPTVVADAARALTGLRVLGAATTTPETFGRDESLALMHALSFDHRSDPEARAAEIASALAAIETVRAKLGLPDGSSFNLLGNGGNIPVSIRNDLDVDVTVTVIVTSRSPILRIDDAPTATILARSTAQVLVPVTAVASGNVEVNIDLKNPDGESLTSVTTVSLRVRAAWGAVFTTTVAAGAALLLIAGVFRTVRRGRRTPEPTPEQQIPGRTTLKKGR